MYKVFINDKVIYFTNNQEIEKELRDYLVLRFFCADLFVELLISLKKNQQLNNIVILVDNYEEAFQLFQSNLKIIKAAGGWVRNSENKSLFIYRLNKWDLPKGKIEDGENNEAAAIREVEEECGISDLKITNQLSDTFHIYELNDEVILKQTYWFEMESDYKGELIPQLEEDITEAEWLSDEDIKSKVLKNTYASIAELIQ